MREGREWEKGERVGKGREREGVRERKGGERRGIRGPKNRKIMIV